MTPARRRGGSAIVFTFAVLLVTVPAFYVQAQEAPSPTLAVTNLEVIGPAPTWIDGEPRGTRIRAVVANTGAVAASYSLAYYWRQAGDYLNGDAAGSTDASRGTLAPGESAVHEADWYLQPDQRGPGAVLAEARPLHPEPRLARRSLPVDVKVHSLAVSWDTPDLDIRPEETRFLRLRVENRGTTTEDLELSLPGGSGYEIEIDRPALVVPAGSARSAHVFVHWPFAPGTAPPALAVRVSLRNETVPQWAPVSPVRTVRPVSDPLDSALVGASIDVADVPLAVPGEASEIQAILRNDGSEDNSFLLEPLGPQGWWVSVAPSRVALRPGEAASLRLTFVAPETTPPGQAFDVAVRAVSERLAAGNAMATIALWSAGPRMAISIQAPERIYWGSEVPVEVALRNVGTATSPDGLLTLEFDPALPQVTALALAAIPAGATQVITTKVLPANSTPVARPAGLAFVDDDEDGLPGPDEPIYLAVRPDAPSIGFGHPTGGGQVAAGDLRIENTTLGQPGTHVQADEPDEGAGHLVRIGLERLGCVDLGGDDLCDGEDDYYLDVGGSVGILDAGDLRITATRTGLPAGQRVAPWEFDTGRFLTRGGLGKAAFDWSDQDGNGVFTPADDVYLDLAGDGSVSPGDIRLTSIGPAERILWAFGSQVAAQDSDVGTALDPGLFGTLDLDGILGPLALTASWGPLVGDLEGVSTEQALFVRSTGLKVTQPANLTAAPGQTLEYLVPPHAFQVTNEGNAPESIALALDADLGNATLLGPATIVLEAGETAIVPVRHTLPRQAPLGVSSVRLTASLAHHNQTQAQSVFGVILEDALPPTVSFLDLPAVWDPLRPLLVAVQASDDVGVANVTVSATGVAPHEAEARQDSLGVWYAKLPLGPGNYTLVASARDAAGRQARTDAVAVRVETVPPPRLLSLLPEPNATVEAGAELRLAVEDPLGLRSATVQVDDGTPQPMNLEATTGNSTTASFRLPDLPPGPHRLRFQVTNGGGRTLETFLVVQVPAEDLPPDVPVRESPAPGLLLVAVVLSLLVGGRRRRQRSAWNTT